MTLPEFHVLIEPHNGASYDDQLPVASTVRALGLAGLFRADHYFSVLEQRHSPWITDTWTTLAGVARDTEDITLGSLVSAATFREPVPLAVIAAQADAMSGGRIELGIGTGWWQAEHDAVGITLPALGERFDRLTDQLDIIAGLWNTPPDSTFSHRGEHHSVRDLAGVACVRPGGPPIIIGGSGARRTPRLAAHYAREFNSGWESPRATAAEFARVDRSCIEFGRDPLSLRKSTVQTLCLGSSQAEVDRRADRFGLTEPAGIHGTPAVAADCVRAFMDAGAERIYLELLDLTDHDQLRLFAEAVLPQLR